jgi:23S rRNA (pseudouridine1915-N3)-methyltransferase
MRFNIIALGNKMPKWVELGFQEYAKRFTKENPLTLIEIPIQKRTSSRSLSRIIDEEGQKVINALVPKAVTIALDERGKPWSTQELATEILNFQRTTSAINFMIGGPDGLSKDCIAKADLQLSLSKLTLPHPIVRILLIEQLYRAVSIINNHPYHRE